MFGPNPVQRCVQQTVNRQCLTRIAQDQEFTKLPAVHAEHQT